MPLTLPHVRLDAQGRSRFDRIDLAWTGDDQRRRSGPNALLWWQVSRSAPRHRFAWTGDEPRLVAVLAGQLDVRVVDGEVRPFARGDALLFDRHAASAVHALAAGRADCELLTIALDDVAALASR